METLPWSSVCCRTSVSIRVLVTTNPFWAAHNGYNAIVERLLQDKRVDPSARDNQSILMAAHNGHIAIVESLLQDKRVDPSARDNHSIVLAAQNGHLAVVERLLQDKRVDPSALENSCDSLWPARIGRLVSGRTLCYKTSVLIRVPKTIWRFV
jgi:hypothetical protein